MQIVSQDDVSVCNLLHNFQCLSSTDMFPGGVSTTRRVHVRVRALKDGCVYFLTYEDMSMRDF